MRPPRQKLQLRAALLAALQAYRVRPLAHAALGAAILLSLFSVFCLVGLFSTPFFGTELFLMQLAVLRGSSTERRPHRLLAMAQLGFAVLLFASVVTVGALSGSPRVDTVAITTPSLLDGLLSTGGAYGLLSGLLAMLFVMPFQFAPLLLLSGQGGLFASLLRSACMVGEGGYLRHLILTLLSHVVQLLPGLVALSVVSVRGDADVAMASLIALPLTALTIPLGQGMIVAAYHQQRALAEPFAELGNTGPGPAPRRRSLRVISRAVWTLVLCSPMVVALLLFTSVLSPSVLRGGAAPGPVLREAVPSQAREVHLYPPATAIAVTARPDRVLVVASDGGGAGRLPLASAAPVTAVRLTRLGRAFGVEVQQRERSTHTVVDAAGVRLDDSWTDRLLSRLSLRELVVLYLCLWLIGLVAGPVLTHLARDAMGMRGGQMQAQDLQRARMHALWAGVALSLPALWALRSAIGALFQVG